VPTIDELAHDGRADHASPAQNENTHAVLPDAKFAGTNMNLQSRSHTATQLAERKNRLD
jgi:hypothetical protein